MRHELWENEDGCTTLCLAGPLGNDARKLLDSGARLVTTIEANSHFEAMTAYYTFMGWGEYRTDQEWDYAMYPNEWQE